VLREQSAARDERQARKNLAELADKRRHPPHPRGRSVAAALSSDPWLADVITRRLRDNIVVIEDGKRHVPKGEFMLLRPVELEDVGVLFVVSVAIADGGGLLRFHTPDRGLKNVADVQAWLSRLRRNGLIEFQRDGAARRVSCGKRALEIARAAGVSIPSAWSFTPAVGGSSWPRTSRGSSFWSARRAAHSGPSPRASGVGTWCGGWRCRVCRFGARQLAVDDSTRRWWLERFSDHVAVRAQGHTQT
jgi:hypothetical protein